MKKVTAWLGWNALWAGGLVLIPKATGVAVFGLATLVVLGGLCALRLTFGLGAAAFGRAPKLAWMSKVTLACVSMMLAVTMVEAVLAALAGMRGTAGWSAGAGLTMPGEWRVRPVHVAGAQRAYYWHNALHVFNKDNFRIAGEFGPRREDTFRVMVVGDSLTYGEGVPAESTYPALLGKQLGTSYRAEVLNLGRRGDQSEDVLLTVWQNLTLLEPDLVVYGVCLNDFLLSGQREYRNDRAWRFSFPMQAHLTESTRVGGLLAKKYDEVLMSLGYRTDFYTDILRDFKGYQRRFARDARAMNKAVVAAGRPPIIAMVLWQSPSDARGFEIAAIAERLLAEAGMQVVPSGPYLARHRGESMVVSPWEGHPNAACHAIFAAELLPAIERTPGLARYRRGKPGPRDPSTAPR